MKFILMRFCFYNYLIILYNFLFYRRTHIVLINIINHIFYTSAYGDNYLEKKLL